MPPGSKGNAIPVTIRIELETFIQKEILSSKDNSILENELLPHLIHAHMLMKRKDMNMQRKIKPLKSLQATNKQLIQSSKARKKEPIQSVVGEFPKRVHSKLLNVKTNTTGIKICELGEKRIKIAMDMYSQDDEDVEVPKSYNRSF